MGTTFIYALICPETNQVRYIGKSNDPYKRIKSHVLKCNIIPSKKNSWLQRLKNKELLPQLEIIEEVPVAHWPFWEQFYISLYKSWGFSLLNMTNGGEDPPVSKKGRIISEETRMKMSQAQKGNKNGLGSKRTAEQLKVHSEVRKGKPVSLGRILSEESRKKISVGNKRKAIRVGWKHSVETKKLMSKIKLSKK